MSERVVQVVVDKDDADAVCSRLDGLNPENWYRIAAENDRVVIVATLHEIDTQETLDAISEALEDRDRWRLVALPSEASLPEIDDEEEQERIAQRETARAREEIYGDIREGTALTVDYLVLTALATVVAAIGLAEDQTAVVIGAMVIAPLLGPIIAFAFAVTLGLGPLMLIAARTLGAGLGVAVVAAVALGLVTQGGIDPILSSYEAPLSLITVALPLASGAAAALMVARGQTSALVGVMVAAALLPPLSAFGLLLGAAQWLPAGKALATVIVNIAAINLAAQVVFRLKGIRPRRWESEAHQTSHWLSLGASAALVALIALAVYGIGHGWLGLTW
ncbi:MAG: TIGR00341 family protein [Maritimibacter sp.]|nr:TIGR00341 family protein [Maritimibacter sp.]